MLDAPEQAIYAGAPARGRGPIHHIGGGFHFPSIRYTERRGEAGIAPSASSVGDPCDDAPAETMIGPFKTEVGAWRSLEAVAIATLEWAEWFQHRRPLEPIRDIPRAEVDGRHDAELRTRAEAASDSEQRASGQLGAGERVSHHRPDRDGHNTTDEQVS